MNIFQPRLYKNVIDEVMSSVRGSFLDEGIDEQVLQEVKQSWEQKVTATRATDHNDAFITGGSGHVPSSQQTQQPLQQTAHQQVAGGLSGQGKVAALNCLSSSICIKSSIGNKIICLYLIQCHTIDHYFLLENLTFQFSLYF